MFKVKVMTIKEHAVRFVAFIIYLLNTFVSNMRIFFRVWKTEYVSKTNVYPSSSNSGNSRNLVLYS